jgi:DNA modification methylase
MAGEQAAVCLTDPPYGIGLDYGEYDDTEENIILLAKDWVPLAVDCSSVLVFSCGVTRQWLYPPPDWVLCWFYGGGQLRSPWGFNCWQPFLAYGKDPSLASGRGARPDAVNMNTPANAKDINHPCPKPMQLWVWLMERLSFEYQDLFYDPFSGSGTTIIAAEMQGRICYGMELSPVYCDVIVQRWQEFTGNEATRTPA